ncbi:hypothetical protein ACW9KT_15650 [Hymenobacter sp. HD11105]
MLLLWLLRLLVPHFDALVNNPVTKEPSSKNLFALLGYYVAIVLVSWEKANAIVQGKQTDNTPILLLLLTGLGLTSAKITQLYLNRKTKDEDGALAQPMPPEDKAKLMPQVGPLSGYNDGPNSTTGTTAPSIE